AVRAAERIGYPVVVKPYNANHGRGVGINLADEAAVRAAYATAAEHATGVIVEAFIPGLDHRMLVIDRQLAGVARREPGHVVGDGSHSIAELVEVVNADPRRGIG